MNPLVSRLRFIQRGLLAREISPFAVTAVAKAVKGLHGGLTVDPPPPSDRLQRLRLKIHALLSTDAVKFELSISEWLDAPWLCLELWGDQVLCNEYRFRNGLLSATAASPKIAKRCIYVFLSDFDPFAPSKTESLRSVILETLGDGHQELAAWIDRNRALKMFESNDGPIAVISNLIAQHPSKPLTECLDESGITSGGFSFAMLLEWCRRAHTRPWEQLQVIESWINLCSGSAAGRVFRFVECLLNPWRNSDPDKEWRISLIAWLQQHYGDPREAVSGVWSEVDPELRAVAIRWLTLQTIEGFFDVLDDYARYRGDEVIRRQWPYRRAFWLAYYRRGVVLDAKVAVGRDMEAYIGWDKLYSRFGNRTARLDAPDSQQSALLLRVRGLIVFVGTHNASCRIWDDTSLAAPDIRRMRFRYNEIVTRPRGDLQIDILANDTGIKQAGAENGTWQRKLRDFIRNKIGVTIQDTEFMP